MLNDIRRVVFSLASSAFCVLLISACGSAQPTTQPVRKSEPTSQQILVGIWKAERVQTQLGPMTIGYDFASDGRVSVSMAQVDGGKRAMSAEGTYQINGEYLVIKRGDKETKHTFKIDGDSLTIIEVSPKGDRFDLKRRPTTRPAR